MTDNSPAAIAAERARIIEWRARHLDRFRSHGLTMDECRAKIAAKPLCHPSLHNFESQAAILHSLSRPSVVERILTEDFQ